MPTLNERDQPVLAGVVSPMMKSRAVLTRFKRALPLAALGGLMLGHLALLAKTLLVAPDGTVRTLGHGDMQLHLAHVTNFAARPFDFQDPLFFGASLQYPFAINYVSGLLLRLTGALELAVLLPVLVLTVANLALAYRLYRRWIGSSSWALWALVLFLLGSGFGAWHSITTAYGRGQTFLEYFNQRIAERTSTMVRLDAHYPEQSVVYGAPLNLAFFDQRAFCAGFFLFLLTLTLLNGKQGGPWRVLGAGVALGLTPLAHTHTFIALAVILVVWWLIEWARGNRELARAIFIAGLIGAALAAPQVVYLIQAKELFAGARPFLRWRLGWMVPDGIGHVTHDGSGVSFGRWLQFLWVNFGVLPLLYGAALIVLLRRARRTVAPEPLTASPLFPAAVCAAVIFVVVNLVQFQPWDFDNNKLLVYAHFFVAPLGAMVLRALWQRNTELSAVAVNLLLMAALLSAVLDAVPRLCVPRHDMPVIFTSDAAALARFVNANIPEGSLILTPAHRANPVLSLAGRPALLGSPSWLWTWGVPFEEREREIKSFYADPAQSDLPARYSLRYVVFDDVARREYDARRASFDACYTKIFAQGEYALYQL